VFNNCYSSCIFQILSHFLTFAYFASDVKDETVKHPLKSAFLPWATCFIFRCLLSSFGMCPCGLYKLRCETCLWHLPPTESL